MSSDPGGEPLSVGMQVRAVDSEPVFSSDPSTGDLGKVIEASPTGYLVRWESGAVAVGLIVALVAFGVRAIRSIAADQRAAEAAKAAKATSARGRLPPQ